MSTNDVSNGAYAMKVAADRTNYFKGSIAVAVIYGVFAVGLFLIAIFSPTAKEIFTGPMMPFIITLVIGILIVVGSLTYWLVTYKPPTTVTFDYDNMKCPDFWKLVPTTKGEQAYVASNQKSRAKYKCVRDTDVLPNGSDTYALTNASTPGPQQTLQRTYMATNKIKYNTNNNQISCNTIYPDLAAYMDKTSSPRNPNQARCEYAKVCGVPWSSVCPAQRTG